MNKTVEFGDYKIEAEVEFESGCPGDNITAPTNDRWNLTGRFWYKETEISTSIDCLNNAMKNKLYEDFDEQING